MDGQELETAEAVDAETPDAPEEQAAEATETETEAPARGGWRGVLDSFREKFGDDDEDDEVPASDDDDDETDPEGEPAAEATEKPDGEKAKEEEPKPESEKPYRIVDAEGNPQAIPEGLKIAFQADGKDLAANLDELVDYAQKGVHADRKFGELGSRIQKAERDRSRLQEEHESAMSEVEKLLEKIAEGDEETLTALEREYQRTRDPEIREALAAKRREDARTRAEAAEQEEQTGTALAAVWDDARSNFAESMKEFEFLAEDDADQVLTDLYTGYLAHRTELIERYTSLATERRQDVAFAEELAEKDAMRFLSKPNLRARMKALNEKIEKRVEPKLKAAGAATLTTKAREHNEYVETKKTQGQTRTIRGGGGVDPTAGRKAEPPRTAKGHLDRVKNIIRSGLGAEDDD